MLRTGICDLVSIEHPVVQAGMGPFGSDGVLAAAVSAAGALGSIGGTQRPLDDLHRQIGIVRERTGRPFVVNFTEPWLQEHPEWFAAALEASVPVVSLALGAPGDRPRRAHDAGALFMQQVHTVEQAEQVAAAGVDVIVAQGTEAGGFTGLVATIVLVPQIAAAVAPIPVLAAGGIADGRGLAAALVLGAQGVNVGTRFLASTEAAVDDGWKRALLEARAEDAVKAPLWDELFPKPSGVAFDVVPRALRTRFLDEWQGERAGERAPGLRDEITAAVRDGRMAEFVPFSGQSAGLIREVLPAAEIVRMLVEEAEAALERAAARRH